QRAADQLGGATGVAIYVGLGFAPALHAGDPFVIAAVLAVIGLIVGAVVISRSPATAVEQPQAGYQSRLPRRAQKDAARQPLRSNTTRIRRPRARPAHLHHRPSVGAVPNAASRTKHQPPPGLSPATHP